MFHASSADITVDELSESRGIKLTSKRKLVLSSILDAKKALSAYELSDRINEKIAKNIPIMSVYRILQYLSGLQLVHKLDSVNKYIVCSHLACNHQHTFPKFLICQNCESVKELMSPSRWIEGFGQDISKHGFEISSDQLELRGLCGMCSNQ